MYNLSRPKTLFAMTVIADGLKRREWEVLSAKPGYEEYQRDSQDVETDVRERNPGDFCYGTRGGIAPV